MARGKSKRQEEKAAQDAFVQQMLAYTARLVRVNGNRPSSGGSGIFYHAGERLFLFSVLHVFERDGWYVETDAVVGNSTLLLEVPPVNWMVEAKVATAAENAPSERDGFAWVEFDVPKLGAKLDAERKKLGKPLELPVYRGPIDHPVRTDEAYGFAASPAKEFVPGTGRLIREPIAELYMSYVGDDPRGFYRFNLARKHQGHDSYRGSSGAPIADPTGRIVALVQGGCQEQDVIFGVPLARFAKYIYL